MRWLCGWGRDLPFEAFVLFIKNKGLEVLLREGKGGSLCGGIMGWGTKIICVMGDWRWLIVS